MLKLFALLTCILLISSAESSRAAPPDSPGTVYIDGLPCNRACQSYMTWSRQALSQQPAPASSQPTFSEKAQASSRTEAQRTAKMRMTPTKNVAPNRVANKAGAKTIPTPPTKATEPQLVNRQVSKPDTSDKKASSSATNPASVTEGGIKPDQPATAEDSLTTANPAPEKQTDDNSQPSISPSNSPANTETAALAPSNNVLVAILLVRPEIKSVSDLANKVVAIDISQSTAVPDVRNAMAAAGAAEVEMSEGEQLALIRVMDGEVPAAVVDVLSPAAADAWNAGIKGFNILRIPLSAPLGKAGRG